jgi:hypothetical protein
MAAALAAGCSDNESTGPQAPPPVQLSETFSGTLTGNGASSNNLDVTRAGDITAEITALTPDDAIVGLALGTWNGLGCQLVITNEAAKQAAVITGTASAPGTFCVRLSDSGQLTGPIDYEVKVDHF